MDAGVAIRGSGRRIRWSRVLAWIPLGCLGLMGIELALSPGKDFYAGRAETLSLVFQHGSEILGGLAAGMIAASVVSMLIFGLRLLWPGGMDERCILPVGFNFGLMVTIFLFTSLFVPEVIPTIQRHVIESTPGHTYYLETLSCFGAIADCPADAFLSHRFEVIDCPSGGLTCVVVFISNPKGYHSGDPFPPGPYTYPQMRRTPTGRVQLLEGDRILWEGS